MIDFLHERRVYPRSALALTLHLHHTSDPFFLGPGLGNVRSTDISAGGVYFKVFESIPFEIDEEVALRIMIPREEGGGVPDSVLGPCVRGRGMVRRIDRVFVHGIAGRGVAIQFEGPLAIDAPHGLTVGSSVR